MAPPLPPPRDNPQRMPFETLLQQTKTNPERFCRKCGQWTIGTSTIECSMCTLLTHDTCVNKTAKLPKHRNYFFVCEQCRGDLKDSVNKYSERSQKAKENFEKLQNTIKSLEAEKQIANEKLAKERADRVDAERARDELRANVNNSARINPNTQARKRPRTVDLAPEQIQTLDIIEQTVESQLAPLNQQLRNVLTNIREQADRPIQSNDRASPTQPKIATRRTKQTFAAAITKSATPTAQIRNINVKITTPEEDKRVAKQIRNDELFAEFDIKSIKQRGSLSFTVTTTTEQGAIQLEQRLMAKYGDRIEVLKVVETRPMVKITRIENTQRSTREIHAQILVQNKWLADVDFEIERTYPVNADPEPYLNLIVQTDLRGQKQMLTHGYIVFGGKECRIYEYVNVLQCVKCQRFGHYARDCTQQPTCRLCAAGHETKDCDADQTISRCANCLLANKSGAKYNYRHRSTDERCYVRMGRIEALKNYFAKN